MVAAPVAWTNGQLAHATLHPSRSGTRRIRYGDDVTDAVLTAARVMTVDIGHITQGLRVEPRHE
ncbi:hypothetical protein GCM10010530_21740 [Kribbella aluminosa]